MFNRVELDYFSRGESLSSSTVPSYSKTALIRLMPEDEDCSFFILKCPNSDVF